MTTKTLMAKTGLKPDGTNYVCPYCLKKIPRSALMRLCCIYLSVRPIEFMTVPVCKDCAAEQQHGDVTTRAEALFVMTKQRLRLPHFTDSNGVRHW